MNPFGNIFVFFSEDFKDETDILLDSSVLEDLEVLERRSDLPPEFREILLRYLLDDDVIKENRPRGGQNISQQKSENGRLARSGWTGDDDKLSISDFECYVRKRGHAGRICLRDVFKAN